MILLIFLTVHDIVQTNKKTCMALHHYHDNLHSTARIGIHENCSFLIQKSWIECLYSRRWSKSWIYCTYKFVREYSASIHVFDQSHEYIALTRAQKFTCLSYLRHAIDFSDTISITYIHVCTVWMPPWFFAISVFDLCKLPTPKHSSSLVYIHNIYTYAYTHTFSVTFMGTQVRIYTHKVSQMHFSSSLPRNTRTHPHIHSYTCYTPTYMYTINTYIHTVSGTYFSYPLPRNISTHARSHNLTRTHPHK